MDIATFARNAMNSKEQDRAMEEAARLARILSENTSLADATVGGFSPQFLELLTGDVFSTKPYKDSQGFILGFVSGVLVHHFAVNIDNRCGTVEYNAVSIADASLDVEIPLVPNLPVVVAGGQVICDSDNCEFDNLEHFILFAIDKSSLF